MNIRFTNAKILTTNANHTFDIVEGELWVKGNRIVYIGDKKDVSSVVNGEDVIMGIVPWIVMGIFYLLDSKMHILIQR